MSGRRDWQANARLMAAAPELLEAASHAATLLVAMFDLYGWPEGEPGTSAVVKELEAAIAKAEGRDQ